MLLTDHTVLVLDSDSLSKVQNINYISGGQTENVVGVCSQLNYTGYSWLQKKADCNGFICYEKCPRYYLSTARHSGTIF
jgi:hypothetical protein